MKKINKKKVVEKKAKAKAKKGNANARTSVKQPKPKKVKSKAKIARNPKAKIKKLIAKVNTGYKQLKDGSYRIYGWKVIDAPRATFKELVIVEHTGKHIKKQFINMPSAVRYIESQESEKLIDSGNKSVIKELKSVGLGPLVAVVDEPDEADVVSVAEQEAEANEENENYNE